MEAIRETRTSNYLVFREQYLSLSHIIMDSTQKLMVGDRAMYVRATPKVLNNSLTGIEDHMAPKPRTTHHHLKIY